MTHSTRTILLAQVMISGMMACLMTGFFGLLHLGPTQAFLHQWGTTFATAWPVAFCFSVVVSPIAFKLAYMLNRFLP